MFQYVFVFLRIDFQPTIAIYHSLMRGYSNIGDTWKAETIFQILKQKNIINRGSYIVMMDGYLNNHKPIQVM